MDTPDLFGGAAVTTKNSVRKSGLSTFAEVAGAATFNANPNDVYEIVFARGTDEDKDEPFGCKIAYTVPCEETPTVSAGQLCKNGDKAGVIDDSVEGDVVVRYWDPEDGKLIENAAGGTVDIDNGDVMNIKYEMEGAFEEAYGNPFAGCGNILVVKYNTSQYTRVDVTDISGNSYPTASVPSLHSGTTGYTSKAWKLPVLLSNAEEEGYIVFDASGSGKEPDGDSSNVTIERYDTNWYLDNDVTPPVIKCGPEDEDGTDVGSDGCDSTTIYIAP